MPLTRDLIAFGGLTHVHPRDRVLGGCRYPPREGATLGLSGPLKSIGSLCCGVRSKKVIQSTFTNHTPVVSLLPPGLPSLTFARTVSSELLGVFVFSFPYFFVSVPCARLSLPSLQLLSAR